MAEYLVIRLPEHPGDAASWIAVDSSGTRISAPATGPLELAAQSAGDRDVIALVPAAGVLTMSVDIPIKRGPRLLAALPFALEEQLAEPLGIHREVVLDEVEVVGPVVGPVALTNCGLEVLFGMA